MNGFIIETTQDATAQDRRTATRWIGIAGSAADMIAMLPGYSPSVVDRGPEVLEHARLLGLKDGEFRKLPD